ncbi:MAG: hypothetical protein RMM29_09465 [Planctomycetota bacterium]|nr:hypothetical protein [Planctomycetota bacterium]MDW8373857.1 hypothetical protein [Planctomycetota bacterium]
MLAALLLVAGMVLGAIVLFGLVVALGRFAVRWLQVPADPVEEALYEPQTPALQPRGAAATAPARAAARAAQAALGQRAYAVLQQARAARELALWVGQWRPDLRGEALAAAEQALQAAERARQAFAADDAPALAAAELAARTAEARLRALDAALPDWQAAERRRLLWLAAALLVSLALAGAAWWL